MNIFRLKKGIRKAVLTAVTIIYTAVCFAMIPAVGVNAAEAYVTFGSSSYTPKEGSEFKIGVYVKCMEGVGAS